MFVEKSKLIDSGTYGCIVTPPIENNIIKIIKKYKNKNKDDVGKIFKVDLDDKKEALKEYKTFIDSSTNIKYYKDIVPEIKGYNIISSIDSKKINDCLNTNVFHKKEIHQLIYRNAGISFYDLPYNFMTYKQFIKAFNLFSKKFKYYIEYGKIHNDINEKNIMIHNNTILLIDFGLEQNKKKIFKKQNLKFFKYKYFYYPPEFRYLYLYYKKSKLSLKKKVDFMYENYNFVSKYFSLDVLSKQYIEEEIENLIENFNLDYKKIDIFSLGINLLSIRDKINFASNDELKRFNNLIKKMIEPNPLKRFSIKEVIKYAK